MGFSASSCRRNLSRGALTVSVGVSEMMGNFTLYMGLSVSLFSSLPFPSPPSSPLPRCVPRPPREPPAHVCNILPLIYGAPLRVAIALGLVKSDVQNARDKHGVRQLGNDG